MEVAVTATGFFSARHCLHVHVLDKYTLLGQADFNFQLVVSFRHVKLVNFIRGFA
jgi:hypothetical protein